MLEGLVQHDHPLTLRHVLERMRRVNGRAEIVTLRDAEQDTKTRASHAEVAARADRLAHGLTELGVKPGDRVATFCWNTQEHLEAYLAVPCLGAVLHTLNLRLFPEQLTYIVNHAEDKVILADASLVPLLAKVAATFEHVEHYVIIGAGADTSELGAEVVDYEELLGRAPDEPYDYPDLDDRAAAGLCYTSGTTGNPKGALYSHRSNILHALAAQTADALAVSHRDRILPVVPMFHVNAWGLPYAGAMAGSDLVMPGPFLAGEALAKLIESERVTLAGAVPTLWMDLLKYADEHHPDLTSLRMVVCGGAAVPRSLMEAFEERHSMPIVQAWGMTETSPLAAVAHPPGGLEGEEHWHYRSATGRIFPLLEFRLQGEDGSDAPWDGEATGEILVKGPWIASSYFEDSSGDDKFEDGWLKTGDIASIDSEGYLRITDRSKDVIKSGGEWISSVELENELMAHPAVAEAAVVAMPHERFTERPLACVVLADGEEARPAELSEHLAPRVAKWWLPDAYAFIDEVPKTSTGKFDKKVLRGRLSDGDLQVESVG